MSAGNATVRTTSSPIAAMRKWTRRIWILAGLLFIAFIMWSAQARGVDPAVFRSTDSVRVVDTGAVIQFIPANPAPGAGLIFLPGGGIDPDAYAPLLRSIAESGHPAVLVKLPWRLAPTAGMRNTLWKRIDAVRSSAAPGTSWVLGGHSRGAAFSVAYTSDHPNQMGGLALIGTTHPRDVDLYGSKLPVLKIYGTQDCVANMERVMANKRLLPPTTQWVRIEGGNHRQFGYYGYQLGDCGAAISRESQQAQTSAALTRFLGGIGH
jgi:pimeloyl-ACP methyl ester carboxylesterase